MMMLPAITAWLPNFFTPRRLLRESRPFLTEPCPFLWAMEVGKVSGCKLACDRGHLERGQGAAEADGLVETLAALEFEGNALGSAVLVDHLCGHGSTFHERSADFHGIPFADEQNVKLDFGIDFGIELFDVELGAFLNAVLFTAGFDHCV